MCGARCVERGSHTHIKMTLHGNTQNTTQIVPASVHLLGLPLYINSEKPSKYNMRGESQPASPYLLTFYKILLLWVGNEIERHKGKKETKYKGSNILWIIYVLLYLWKERIRIEKRKFEIWWCSNRKRKKVTRRGVL